MRLKHILRVLISNSGQDTVSLFLILLRSSMEILVKYFTLQHVMKVQRVSTGIAVLFL
jgi:hypothetical protein